MLTLRFLSVLVLLTFCSPVAVALEQEGALRVVDGDTLVLQGETVRLFGIDAPELGQSCDRQGQSWDCGAWSAQMLAKAVAGWRITCAPQDIDRYGRTVAICHAGETDLGRAQVQAGAALAYTRYSTRYVADEARAKSAKVGLWAGRMVTPEAQRRSNRPPPQEPPARCQIKGNISASGKIYHQPGQRDYEATRINPRKGEAWFCTTAEAEAAGFRAARR